MNSHQGNSNPSHQQANPGQPSAPNRTPADQAIEEVPLFIRKRAIIPMLLVLLAILAGGSYWYVQRHTFVSTDDAFIDANRATISSRVPGRIIALRADENDTVQAGDTLAVLDDGNLQAQLEKAQAAVRFLEQSEKVSAIKIAKALEDFARAEKQYKSHIITQEQYSNADNTKRLSLAQRDMVQAQVATARADIDIIKTQLENTVITAPFSGVIVKRWLMPGDVVQPSQAIFSLYDIDHVWVTANYQETKLRTIQPGMEADIGLDAFPGITFHGKVLSIGKSTAAQFSLIPASNAAGNFTKITQRVPIKLSITAPENGPQEFLPGLSASVHILSR